MGNNVRSAVLGLSAGLSGRHVIILLTGATGDIHVIRDRIGSLARIVDVGDAAMSLLLLVLGKDVVAWGSGRAGEAVAGRVRVCVEALRVVECGEVLVCVLRQGLVVCLDEKHGCQQ